MSERANLVVPQGYAETEAPMLGAERHSKNSYFRAQTMGSWITSPYMNPGGLDSRFYGNNRAPVPLKPLFVTHPMDMECNLCTFVLKRPHVWELKYINRACSFHTRFIGGLG
jgi:hypothetical protein